MNDRKIIYFIFGTLIVIALLLAAVISNLGKKNGLNVYFLNVGQGDAVLISDADSQVLIDSGRNGKITLEKLGKAMPFWDRKIEAAIITHPDADHYGGFDEIFDFYEVENVIRAGNASEGEEWLNLVNKIKDKKITEIESAWGTEIVFPSGAKLKIIYPLYDNSNEKDKNENSIVSRLVFGENEFLFTGDLPQKGESFLANSDIDIQADFLKIGHHGSKTSSADNFLDKVKPQQAVISVGKDNNYGHPHEEVLEKLRNRAVLIRRTDEGGNIKYECKNIKEICRAVE